MEKREVKRSQLFSADCLFNGPRQIAPQAQWLQLYVTWNATTLYRTNIIKELNKSIKCEKPANITSQPNKIKQVKLWLTLNIYDQLLTIWTWGLSINFLDNSNCQVHVVISLHCLPWTLPVGGVVVESHFALIVVGKIILIINNHLKFYTKPASDSIANGAKCVRGY